MLYTSRIKVSTNPLRKKKIKEKTNHTKIKNEPVNDTKLKNWTLGKIVFLKKKILENPNLNKFFREKKKNYLKCNLSKNTKPTPLFISQICSKKRVRSLFLYFLTKPLSFSAGHSSSNSTYPTPWARRYFISLSILSLFGLPLKPHPNTSFYSPKLE